MKTLPFLLFSPVLAAVAAAAPIQSASLSVSLRPAHLEFVRGESLAFTGEVRNAGPAVLIVDDYGPYRANAVKIYVRNAENERLAMPVPNAPASVVPSLTVVPGGSKPFEVDLRAFYDLPAGRYTASAMVCRGEESATSKPVSFTIVEGVEIRAQLHAGPGRGDRPLRYALSYWGRERREELFLRITDPSAGGALRGFVSLGALVRVADPTLRFDGQRLTIVKQVGRDRFSRTVLDVSSMPPRVLEHEDGLLSAEALREQLTTRLVEERIDEAVARRNREGGGLFERHRTRIPPPSEEPSAITPVPKD